MKSPCIGVCSTVLGDDVCRGCGRTLEEIRAWAAMSDEQRDEIMRRVEDEQRSVEALAMAATSIANEGRNLLDARRRLIERRMANNRSLNEKRRRGDE